MSRADTLGLRRSTVFSIQSSRSVGSGRTTSPTLPAPLPRCIKSTTSAWTPNFIYLAWEIDLDFVDNSYGINRNKGANSPWPAGHSFFDLAESDGQRLQILNVCGEDVVDVFMDYLDGPQGGGPEYDTPSGYDTDPFSTETLRFLINGGDWSDLTYKTSELWNLNSLGFCTNLNGTADPPPDCDDAGTDLLVDSPPWADEDSYTPQAPYGAWQYKHLYEMRIARSVFSTPTCAQGTPALIRTDPVELHASPSKIGQSPVDLFRAYSTIGDFIWLDRDRDGVQDVGEPGIANVTVDLYTDPNGDGNPSDGRLQATTTTDTYGRYAFTRLGRGSYVVDVTDTNGILTGYSLTVGPQSQTDPSSSIDLPLQEEYFDADFGYAPTDTSTAAVGDFVWLDADQDGIQDLGEPGIANVTLDLIGAGPDEQFGTADDTTQTSTTSASGSYLFSSLPPGDYYVDVTDTSGVLAGHSLTTGPQSETDPSTPFRLAAGDVFLNADFGYFSAVVGTIGNVVFFDVNEDGDIDTGEPGFGNVTVSLVADTDGDGIWDAGELILATARTDVSGNYQFNGLALDDGDGDGDYLVVVTDTLSVLGSFLESIVLPFGSTTDGVSKLSPYAAAVSPATTSNPTADFGYLLNNPEGLVGDRVWYDADGDGIQGPNEPGIEGVTVEIWSDKNKDGVIDLSRDSLLGDRTTDINGNYFFSRLKVDNNGEGYVVVITDTDNVLANYDQTGDPDEGGACTVCDGRAATILSSSTTGVDLTIDFGYQPNGAFSIGDTVYNDLDADGVQDAGEPGFQAVTVGLYDDLNGDGIIGIDEPLLAVFPTDANGNYLFSGLVAGNYLVAITDTLGILNGYTQTQGAPVEAVALGPTTLDVDFGFVRNPPAQIGNRVWDDADADGIQDPGELGLAGVTVRLLTPGANGIAGDADDVLVATTTTNPSGNYLFTVTAGLFYLDFDLPAGYFFSPQDQGADETADSDADPTTGSTAVFSMVLGEVDLDWDAGVFGEASVGDRIWSDDNGDGIQDAGEPGIQGVVIELLRTSDGSLLATVTTAADGSYIFPSLRPGNYTVFLPPVNFLPGGALESTVPTGDPDEPGVCSVCDRRSQTILTPGQADVIRDFGYEPSATLAVVSSFRTYAVAGGSLIEFETASELGTLGFWIWRFDVSTGTYMRVNEEILPSVGAGQGGRYRYLDEGTSGEELTYALVEIEVGGGERVYGPFSPKQMPGRAVQGSLSSSQTKRTEAAHLARQRPQEANRQADDGSQRRLGFVRSPTAARVEVDQDGMQLLSSADIASALGSPLEAVERWIAQGTLRLEGPDGDAIAWSAEPGNGGLIFHGEAAHSTYTDSRLYRLERGRGETMAEISGGSPAPALGGAAFREQLHFEVESFPGTVVSLEPEEDFWYWVGLWGGHSTWGRSTLSLDVPDPIDDGRPVTLSARLYGASSTAADLDHLVNVHFNGIDVGTVSWDGVGAHEVSLQVPGWALRHGDNSVELTALLPPSVRFSFVYLDSFDLDYSRAYRAVDDQLSVPGTDQAVISVSGFTTDQILAFETTDSSTRRITGAKLDADDGYRLSFRPQTYGADYQFLSRRGLHRATATASTPLDRNRAGAEYLVIAPRQLLEGAQRLADLRAQRRWSTAVIELESLHMAYGGIASPTAIRDFLADAWREWSTRPRFLVLVGAGGVDYLDQMGLGGNLMPPLMTRTPTGLYAADNLFADLEGNDGVPELAVGRIPATTPAELDAYVDKLIAHELAAASGRTIELVLSADDADHAGNFSFASDSIAARVPDGFARERIYLDELPIDEARSRLIESLDRGVGFWNYFGHGGIDRLATEGLFTSADVAALSNGDALPIVTSLTCTIARFELPGFGSLAESLVMAEDSGAIAVWSATGTSVNNEARQLADDFFAEVYEHGADTLGEAIREALAAYSAGGGLEYMGTIYTLLGDPAIALDVDSSRPRSRLGPLD